MRRLDKMTKLLLGLIALLLGMIALKPILKLTPEARAQTGAAAGSGSSEAAAPQAAPAKGITLLTRIVVRDPVLGVQTMDNSGVFFLWTKNTVEVYRVD